MSRGVFKNINYVIAGQAMPLHYFKEKIKLFFSTNTRSPEILPVQLEAIMILWSTRVKVEGWPRTSLYNRQVKKNIYIYKL
jgi:hypothetical protein